MAKIYRSTTDKVLGGVIGGIAAYLRMDATVLRVAWTLVTLFTGVLPGVIAYILAVALIPDADKAGTVATY